MVFHKLLKLYLIIILTAIVNSGFSQEVKCKNPTYKFGFVTEGDTVSIFYELKNSGDKPLIISNYEVECGCTLITPDFPGAIGSLGHCGVVHPHDPTAFEIINGSLPTLVNLNSRFPSALCSIVP